MYETLTMQTSCDCCGGDAFGNDDERVILCKDCEKKLYSKKLLVRSKEEPLEKLDWD